jgi:hypothetical protein
MGILTYLLDVTSGMSAGYEHIGFEMGTTQHFEQVNAGVVLSTSSVWGTFGGGVSWQAIKKE